MTKIILPALLAIGLVVDVAAFPQSAAAQDTFPDRPLSAADLVAAPRRGPLTDAEMEMARTAWRYFQNNTQDWTGLANAADQYPSTTLWDTASYIAAIVSAQGLGLIGDTEADARLGSLLRTLAGLDLFRQSCPNKVYDTRSGLPADYANQPGEIGCSALDIGRLLVWLRIAEQRHPRHAPLIHRTLSRWNWCDLAPGRLQGAALDGQCGIAFLQEGRLGYEEYAARGFELWGFDAEQAMDPEPYDTVWLYDAEIPYDARDPRLLGAHNYVVTESFALWGVEFGWTDPAGADTGAFVTRAAQNIYTAQERRHEATGILTARTEHQLLEDPFFVYDTLFSDGRPWATLTEAGRWAPEDAAVATKGALGLWALWDTPYTDALFEHIADRHHPEGGYYEGIFEDGRGVIETQTANNNGIMLETLLFKVEGPLLRPVGDPAAWAAGIDPAAGRCLPAAEEPRPDGAAEAGDARMCSWPDDSSPLGQLTRPYLPE